MQSQSNRPRRVAKYLRVSSDEQRERQTIKTQVDFLDGYAKLYGLEIVDTYADDGVSGTLPLEERPEGARLLADVAAGTIDEVLVYKLDRFARTLETLLDGAKGLDAAGVALKSATESIDTSTPAGRMAFHILGVVAEFGRATFLENVSNGRKRAGREGKWTGGPIPFGYDLDPDRRLIESTRVVESAEMTEADLVRSLFARVAGGESGLSITRWIVALGVPAVRRFSGGAVVDAPSGHWDRHRVSQIIKNPTYKGYRDSVAGRLDTPELVNEALWQRANDQFAENRRLSRKNATRVYALRGLIRCALCGRVYSGVTYDNGPYYKCGAALVNAPGTTRCQAKAIAAATLEGLVWADLRAFAADPDAALERARATLDARLGQAAAAGGQAAALATALAALDQRRTRVVDRYELGQITGADCDGRLARIDAEAADLERQRAGVAAEAAAVAAWETKAASAAGVLAGLAALMDRAEHDAALKREIVARLVERIEVHTTGAGRKKKARVVIHYAFWTEVDGASAGGTRHLLRSDDAPIGTVVEHGAAAA